MICYIAEWWEFTESASHDRELLIIADEVHDMLDIASDHVPYAHLRPLVY